VASNVPQRPPDAVDPLFSSEVDGVIAFVKSAYGAEAPMPNLTKFTCKPIVPKPPASKYEETRSPGLDCAFTTPPTLVEHKILVNALKSLDYYVPTTQFIQNGEVYMFDKEKVTLERNIKAEKDVREGPEFGATHWAYVYTPVSRGLYFKWISFGYSNGK